MIIKRTSPFSGELNEMNIDVTADQIKKWQEGELIQNAMPNISSDEREFILSGITPDEWDGMFGDDEYE